MLRRRQIKADPGTPSPHSTLTVATSPVREVAWIVEERVMWRGADLLRGILDAVKWTFERLAWLAERRLVWPLQERSAGLRPPSRATGAGALAAVLIGAGALVVVVTSGGRADRAQVATPAKLTIASHPLPPQPQPPRGHVLHGAAPVFAPAPRGSRTAPRPTEAAAETATPARASSATASAAPGEIAGPLAVAVARRFSDAFVHYETGQANPEVRTAFRATATPQLSASLLHRPPRLPANVKVPQAKVLNVVPGPQLGDNCAVSVSLLRVGLTSELRLSMHREKGGNWQVKDVLG